MQTASEKHHQEALLRLVRGESTHYFLLHIWDGRYAAFWKDRLKTPSCAAVAERFIKSCGWPFAFIGASFEEVRDYINRDELEIVKEHQFLKTVVKLI